MAFNFQKIKEAVEVCTSLTLEYDGHNYVLKGSDWHTEVFNDLKALEAHVCKHDEVHDYLLECKKRELRTLLQSVNNT